MPPPGKLQSSRGTSQAQLCGLQRVPRTELHTWYSTVLFNCSGQIKPMVKNHIRCPKTPRFQLPGSTHWHILNKTVAYCIYCFNLAFFFFNLKLYPGNHYISVYKDLSRPCYNCPVLYHVFVPCVFSQYFIGGHWNCLQFLVITNYAEMNNLISIHFVFFCQSTCGIDSETWDCWIRG